MPSMSRAAAVVLPIRADLAGERAPADARELAVLFHLRDGFRFGNP